ncbi:MULTISPECIES: hypothetical protein [Pseudomonas]|uniref:Uncharacterized protein n=2 Tax=Pseudomonas TaxID=286 RepID=A0A0D0SI41_PSEFL|nr:MULTISPECIES: hypothetical protein [Pseudomonas fluorescens group]AZE59172.1 hypothetical protein C4K02_0788 [Pseudomonas synxantha]KIR21648.1 hypothetical protein PFLU3_28420 [Pseudomonas fluorescens]
MYFFTDLSDPLFSNVERVKKNYTHGKKNLEGTFEDARFFKQITGDIFYAKMALNESLRINHLMIKATIESVP